MFYIDYNDLVMGDDLWVFPVVSLNKKGRIKSPKKRVYMGRFAPDDDIQILRFRDGTTVSYNDEEHPDIKTGMNIVAKTKRDAFKKLQMAYIIQSDNVKYGLVEQYFNHFVKKKPEWLI